MSFEESTWRGAPCAYCTLRPSVSRDHVVPKSLRKRVMCKWVIKTGICRCKVKHRAVPIELLELVPACFRCNTTKGTRRLVPQSWEPRISLLNEHFPGTPWRTWAGDVTDANFRRAFV